MRRPVRVLPAFLLVAAAAVVMASTNRSATAAGPLDALTYKVRTIFAPAGGTPVERTADGVLLVPTPVDVDGVVTTGLAGGDVLVQLTIDAGRATFRVSKLPGAPAQMPLLIEAILADPRGGSAIKVAFGYDARASTAPDVYSATIHLIGAGRVTSFGLDVETVSPGSTIAVIAEVFTEGAGGERVEPQRGRVALSPVPTVVHFGILQGSDLGTQQSGLDLVTDTPTTVDVIIEDIQQNRSTVGVARIDRVPHLVQLVLTESNDGRATWNYQASDRIDLITLEITETAGAAITDQFALRLEDMATSAVLVQDTATHMTFQADSAIGAVQAGASHGRAVAWRNDPAYVYSTTDGSSDSFAFRILGLSRAELDTGDPFVVDVTLAPGPLHVLIEDGAAVLDGWIRDLPAEVRLVFSESAGTIEYTGSDPIAEIDIRATDPGGIAGRATRLEVLFEDVGRRLSLGFGEASGVARLDAHEGSIGRVTLLLTSGPALEVDAGFDGVVLHDTPDRYVLAGRLTGLRLVSVTTADPPYRLELRKTAGPFLVHLLQDGRDTRIEIKDLPAELEATFDPGSGTLDYSGSAAIGSITAVMNDPEGISGRAIRLELGLTDVPKKLTLGFSGGSRATLNAHDGRIGRLDLLLTSGPVREVDAGFDGVVYEDLPSHEALAVRLNGLRLVDVSTAAPYSLDLRKDAGPFLIRIAQNERRVDVEAHDLPDSVQATLDPGAGTFAYDGSAVIGRLTANVVDPAGITGRATKLLLTVEDLPKQVDLSYAAGSTASIDAHGAAIGLVDILATSGPDLAVPAGFDGIVLEDLTDRYAFAVRLRGLKLVSASTASPYALTVQKAAGPFLLQLDQGARHIRLEARDLPDSIQATLDSAVGRLTYSGSSTIGRLDALVRDPAGVSGRATLVRARIDGIPTNLTLQYLAGAAATIDAHGSTVGLIDVLATSGPELSVDAGFDGVVLEDLPSHYAFAVRLAGLKVVSVSTGAAPYRLVLQKTPGPFLVRLLQGARRTEVAVRDLPSSLDAMLNPAGSLAYTASATIGRIDAEIVDPAGVTGRATRATALLTSLPTTLDLSWAAAGGGTITADAKGQTLGLLEVLLTNGPTPTLPASQDGVIVNDIADFSAFARLTGLRKATFAQGPPPSITLDTTGGREFVVSVQTAKPGGIAVTTATITTLPSSLSLTFTSPTAIRYSASGPVSTIQMDAYDPAGISGRATSLHGLLQSLPTRLDVNWGAGGTIGLDAFGGTVGLVEVQLTSGPDDRLGTQYDGFLLRDVADRYVVFARLTGLRRVVATQGQAPDILVETTGNRLLRADVLELAGGKETYTRATLDRLPSSVRLRLVDTGRQEIFYNASAATNSLSFETNAGDRWAMTASLANPLPASVYFCQASNSACGGSGRGANAGSATFTASGHTTIDLFDCVRPANSSCPSSLDEYTRVTNLRVRRMTFDGNASGSGESGHIYLDTDGYELTGNIHIRDGSSGFNAQFDPGFWSENRLGTWSLWGLIKNKSGSVNCNAGLDIRVLGLWIGVTSYLC